MSLRSTQSVSEVPKGAILVNENDALIHQWTIIRSWPKLTEAWPFRLGIPLLGAAGTIGGLAINGHFRRQLKLHTYGKLSTSLTMGLTPAIIISASHAMFVTHDIFLNKTQCLLCLQQKAIFLEVAFGFTYPLVLSPLANFLHSTRHGTYRLPHWGDYKGTIKLWWKFVKSAKEKFLVVILFQALAAAFITYKEKESLLNIQLKMLSAEAEVLESRAKKKQKQSSVPEEPN
ncbi:uncharacterized protein LOC107048731 [Diachasma alloeum]|uniref:uncharacterized protein LOC107048731 n=1 Tax=Diachasma alloeum TaxID=454923 RepID=UPI0007384F57|nr:uncharacterized protein LOC107048731 [Diachasma alloeum]